MIIHLGRSKGDQERAGAVLGIPCGVHQGTCPVIAYRVWLDASGITSGPAFRRIDRHGRLGEQPLTGASVALIVKRAVTAASMAEGMTTVEAARYAHQYAGHSLRAGHATMAATNDAPGHAIQQQLRHRKFDTTSGYIRLGRLFNRIPAGHWPCELEHDQSVSPARAVLKNLTPVCGFASSPNIRTSESHFANERYVTR